ncbi:phage portal protein [Clostridia bacterium]|nr:phage portal protein [Clostridia bacterium]
MIVRGSSAVGADGIGEGLLRSVLREFQGKPLERMERAKRYYDGEHAITERVKAFGTANNKVVAAYPKYITTIASGYLVGSPIQYAGAADAIVEAYSRANVESVDVELAQNASIYGVAVEIVYFGEDSRPRCASLDPRSAFVVYDDTVEHAPLFGVTWSEAFDDNGEPDGFECKVYMAFSTQIFSGTDMQSLKLTNIEPHPLGRVPIVEYWNNADECGDFDGVIPLIDAYDLIQSDRTNDKQAFVESLLVFTGVGEVAPPIDSQDNRTVAQRLREDKILTLPDSEASVQWLTKALDESDTQVLTDSIKSDIHKFSMVPDLSDQNFGGNISGISLRYKLFGLEQLTKGKQRWFEEGLRERLRLFAEALSLLGSADMDVDEVTITFTRSLPVNELEIAQEVQMLQGIVPNELLLTQLPFITDSKAAIALLNDQKNADTARVDTYFNTNNYKNVEPVTN